MANFLKLNKSYLGPEVLSNGSFEEYGPELNTDPTFINNGFWIIETGVTFGGGKILFDNTAADNGFYKNTLTTDGKSYEATINISEVTSGSVYFNIGSLRVGTFSTVGVHTIKFSGAGTNVFGVQSRVNTTKLTIDSVSIKETGAVELVDNGRFANVVNGTDVTTLSQWSGSSLASQDIVSNSLVCTSNGDNQFVALNVDTVSGTEYKFKVDSITGGAINSLQIQSPLNIIDTTSGSIDVTFTADSAVTVVRFYAGDRIGVDTTTYTNISLQATNQFAYGYKRSTSGDNQGGSSSVFDLSSKTLRFIAPAVSSYNIENILQTASGEEYLVKIDVALIVGSSTFNWFDGVNNIQVNLKVGENELRYKRLGGNNTISFGITAQNASQVGSSFTLNSISLQEVENQPKLIGVDNVSTVSALTDNTVVINNGLTEGADELTITYAGASASSRVQMRNFFQDSIIRLANSNNTAEVLEITPPVLITDIVAS
jgi:hypothetical protein